MNLATWLDRSTRQYPDLPALALGARTMLDFRAFGQSVAALAAGLRDLHGVRPGDRVALLAANEPACLTALYAIWWCGAVAVPVNAKLHVREAGYILDDAEVALALVSAEWQAELAGAGRQTRAVAFDSPQWSALLQTTPMPMVPRDLPDLAWLFYTSGTTGRPKGAMLTHGNLAAMTLNYFADVDAIAPGDAILHAAPVSHGSGLYNFAHVLAGAVQVFPDSRGFDPAEIVALCHAHRGVAMFAAPTMVKRLADHVEATGATLPGLKTIIYGGGPMYVAERLRAMRVFGPRLVEIYGQGETPMTISVMTRFHHADADHPRRAAHLASVGVPMSAVEVAIRGEDGEAMAPGETGEVCVRGPTVMAGYWRQPEATARALREGWLWTGDLGALDEDGFLALKGRSKDLIISGGSNIYPREVEEALLTHPAVAEASVVGKRDEEWGEVVVAFVVARGAAPSAAELGEHCLAHIARFKRPKEYRFVDSLPKNNYGKVLKTALRELL